MHNRVDALVMRQLKIDRFKINSIEITATCPTIAASTLYNSVTLSHYFNTYRP